MILIDCGNYRLKGQRWQGASLVEQFETPYHDHWAIEFSNWLDRTAASQCFLASVLDPDKQATIDRLLEKRFATTTTRFKSEPEALGVRNGYHRPSQLGVDRWLGLLAAAQSSAGDCIVIDAGSAITVDLLRADGRHLGGAILPGIETSMERFKQIFHYLDFDHPEIAQSDQPGCSTQAAIQIDCARGSIETLVELIRKWSSLLDDSATLVLTGGDASRVQTNLSMPSQVSPDLVFRGMRRLALS